ncbi:MAG: hypothetical protein K2Y05_06410 [Hyphomicrobiaceae bacterium]|nr:hypothetical protein [Hyphomicrobiaceae bacterium]
MTTAPITAAPAGTAATKARGLSWFLSRAILGLIVMLAVTGIAALIAHASIDNHDVVEELAIGTPAAPLLSGASTVQPAVVAER